MTEPQHCPTCGCPVRVVSDPDGEGTNHYEPIRGLVWHPVSEMPPMHRADRPYRLKQSAFCWCWTIDWDQEGIPTVGRAVKYRRREVLWQDDRGFQLNVTHWSEITPPE